MKSTFGGVKDQEKAVRFNMFCNETDARGFFIPAST